MTDSSPSGWQVLARAYRWLLAIAAILIVAWAFVWVAVREVRSSFTAGDEVELVLMHWSGGGGEEEDAIVADSIRVFEERNPGIRVKRINPGDSGQYFTKLQTMMAAGEPPDVFYMADARMPTFVKSDQLASLDDRLAGQGELALDDFFTPAVDAFRFNGRKLGDGPLYGVPKDFTTVGFYWNRDLFDRAGARHPRPGWTWDEFIEAARAVARLDDCTGAEIVTWPFVLRSYLWTHGVDILDADGDVETLTMSDPALLAALQTLRDWRFEEEGTLVRAEAEGIDPASLFLAGRLGMVGPFGRWVVPNYRKIEDFKWDFAPLPSGGTHANVIATVAWSMSNRSRHPDEAWKLLAWLVGEESQDAQARLGLAIPTLKSVARSDAFIDPTIPPASDQVFLDEVEFARVPAWPIDPAFQDQLQRTLDVALRTGGDVAEQAAELEGWWNDRRNSPLAPSREFSTMPWGWIIIGTVMVFACVGLVVGVRMRASRPASAQARAEERAGWLMASPWMLGFVIFLAGPILLSLFLSFARWKGLDTIAAAEFVGLANYQVILGEDETFLQSLKVTVYYALLAVPLGQGFALLAAVILNARIRGVEFFRAAWYLPSVLAGVGMAVLWTWVFRSEGGLANTLLAPLLSPFGLSPPEWFQGDARIFGAPAFAIMNLWLVGGSMLIYLAGLRNIPEEVLEAADIDGARPISRFMRVTLPMLSPVILFNGIMAIIGSFQVFTQAFVMTGGGPGNDTRFYVLYLYNLAFDWYELGYASALAWILLVIVLLLTGLVMRFGGSRVHYEGMRA